MKELVFMRHGHSLSTRESGAASDAERPLSPRGEREALAAAARLKASGFAPSLIVSSPYLRAARTAQLAAGVFAGAELRADRALSDGPAQALLDLVRSLETGADRVLLVGHQPLLGALAGYFTGEDAYDLAPAGYVRAAEDAVSGKASLVEFYSPPPPEAPV